MTSSSRGRIATETGDKKDSTERHDGWIRRACRNLLSLSVVLLITVLGALPSLAAAEEPIRVVGQLPLELSMDQQQEFVEKTLALANITRAKDNVIHYSCNSDIEHPGHYVFDEVWPSEEALKAHLQTEHFKEWWSWVEPHLDGNLAISIANTDQFHSPA